MPRVEGLLIFILFLFLEKVKLDKTGSCIILISITYFFILLKQYDCVIVVNKGGEEMFGLGPWELLIILLIVLIIFGAGRLPQLGSSLGKGIRNFRASLKGEDSESQQSSGESEQQEEKEN